MDQYRRLPIDWGSRFLSFLSLAVALGGIGFLYSQNNPAAVSDEQIERLVADRVQAIVSEQGNADSKLLQAEREKWANQIADLQAEVQGKQQQWSNEIKTALDKFQDDADATLNQWQLNEASESSQRQVAFNDFLQQLDNRIMAAKPETQTPSAADFGNSIPDAEITSQEDMAGDRTVGGAAKAPGRLRYVDLDEQPSDGNSSILTLVNDGDSPVEVTRVRFRPRREFAQQTNTSSLKPLGAQYVSLRVLSFRRDHNTAADKKTHSYYVMDLPKPIQIAPNQQIQLRLNLANSDFLKWGYSGDVTLSYGLDRTLQVPGMRLNFVDDYYVQDDEI
ncbi:MAG: hypothetical protein R3C28_20190 [Pirellulaceae bacterium]